MKNLNLRALLVPVGIIAVGLLIFGAGFFTRGSYDNKQEKEANNVASQFVDNVLAGDSEAAYSLMSNDYQERMNKELFADVVSTVKTDSPEKKPASSIKADGVVTYYQQVGGLKKNASGKTEVGFLVTVIAVDGKTQVSDASLQ